MPISADRERTLLNHYRIATLYPERWPLADNDSSDDDDDAKNGADASARHAAKLSGDSRSSFSRYRNIDRHASVRSQTTDSESLVQTDEPDALGMNSSVATQLKRRGVPIEQSAKVRNRFMLSSTSFNPASFLATVHQDDSLDDLLRGLDHLSQSIEQKSASLKVLVESNFEKFVKAKATIDNVYIEMRTQGVEPEPAHLQEGRRPQSRQLNSRNPTHFRNSSGQFRASGTKKGGWNDKRKNALTKESEYGVQGIKAPLQEVAIRAEEVWGPGMGTKEREEAMKNVITNFDHHRDVFELSGRLRESVRQNDYDSIVDASKRAKKHADAARNLADIAKANNGQLSDGDAQLIIVTARMWHDVDGQINRFKHDVARRLRESHERKPAAVADETDKEEHMQLIGVLIQLGVEENPISQWLKSRYLYLKDKVARSFERSRIEIEILRRKLAGNATVDVLRLAQYLKSVANAHSLRVTKETSKEIDAPSIISFWEKVQTSLTALLSTEHGILIEVTEYWETLQSFIDNKAQKAFSKAVVEAAKDRLELPQDEVASLRAGVVELITLIRESVLSFFSDAPVEDLSDLYSPIPPTPKTPDASIALTPTAKKAFAFDASAVPPPSPKRGDAWEKFAFWPPQANSLSGSLYLSRILIIIGSGASEMALLPIIQQDTSAVDALKTLVATARERCVQAVCAAWDSDAERCKILETWIRLPERKDLTRMPSSFSAFEERVLANMQRIAYKSDVGGSVKGSAEVIASPSAKLLQALRGTFVTSLYKALSGMVENAERGKKNALGEIDPDGVTNPKSAAVDGDNVVVAVDSGNRNIRLLLTMSNLAHLRMEIIPQLISQFETAFSVKLTDESKTIRDVLGQIDARLFQSYVQPAEEQIKLSISTGIAAPDWDPGSARPTDARPYVYDVLLKLVLVHSEVTATASTLTAQILSYLLEQSSIALIEAFKQRSSYSLAALMQATLDVEFMAQTLNNYTTEKAGEVQSQIYVALDERTDHDARARLQTELPGMRSILKRLRESTKGEFGCFKKERRGRSERSERPGSSKGEKTG